MPEPNLSAPRKLVIITARCKLQNLGTPTPVKVAVPRALPRLITAGPVRTEKQNSNDRCSNVQVEELLLLRDTK